MNDPTPTFGRFTAEPDQTTPPDADDLLCMSEDAIKLARFARRDNLAVQQKLRIEAIESAIAHLEDAKRMMLGVDLELCTQETSATISILASAGVASPAARVVLAQRSASEVN